MLQLILQHVGEFLHDRHGSSIAEHEYLSQNSSKGRVEGLSLLVFGKTENYPLLVAKGTPLSSALVREGRPVIRIEYENLAMLERIGMNRDHQTTPAPLGIWEDGGVLITLQSALPGQPLETIPPRKRFSRGQLASSVEQVIDWWKSLQGNFGVQRQKLDREHYHESVLKELETFSKRFVIDPEEQRFLQHRFKDRCALLGVELPLLVRHGDFCPANMVLQPAGIGVFDWEWPLRHHLPLFDLFHFFASLRYTSGTVRGGSSHYESYVEVFWGESDLNDLLRDSLTQICVQYEIPIGAVRDLFLLSLLQIANLKYEALIEYGLATEPDGATTEGALWNAVGGADKDVPLACIKNGVSMQLRHLVRNGFPPCMR